jgi:hypothetical protein
MDFTQLGLNAGINAGIVGLTEIAKLFFGKKALPNSFILVPMALGAIAAAFLTAPWGWQAYGEKAISYAGVAILAYQAAKRMLRK